MSEREPKKRGRYGEHFYNGSKKIPKKVLRRYENRTGHAWEDDGPRHSRLPGHPDPEMPGPSAGFVPDSMNDSAADIRSDDSGSTSPPMEDFEDHRPQAHPHPYDSSSDSEDFVSDLYSKLALDQLLYEGTEVTVGQALLSLTVGYKRFKLSKACLDYFIGHLMLVLPANNNHPRSLHKFLNIVNKLSPGSGEPTVSYYCNNCVKNEVPTFNSVCDKCNSKVVAVHVQNDLPGLIKDMFEHQNLSKLIDDFSKDKQTRRNNGEVALTDVCDGTQYLRLDKKKYDLCLIQNCDGFPIFGSATAQVWPNFLTIADIPLKFRKKFIILSNLWYAYKKPNMHEFMKPFVETMKLLAVEGIDWTEPRTNKKFNSKVFVLVSVADAQARAPLQNLNACTGFFGCSFCEIQGENYRELASNTVYFPYSETPSALRNKDNMLSHAADLHKELTDPDKIRARKLLKKPDPTYIKGVKGFSCISFLPKFDIGASFTPEYMHSCMLGVVKSHLMDILDSKNKNENFYVGLYGKVISKYLNEIRVPSFISRFPRDLTNVKYWKASEFRNWLLYYSLPCLETVWKDDKFLKHFALLVFAIHTFLKSKIPINEVIAAENAIKKFCSKFSQYYGKDEMTFNLHMLLHYTKSVIDFGPLYAHSAFIFENENGILKERIHGTGNIAVELVNTTKIINSIRGFQVNCQSSDFFGKQRVFLSCREDRNKISPDVLAFVRQLPNIGIVDSTLNFYLRLNLNGIVFTTENYTRSFRSCSYYLAYKEDLSQVNIQAVKALYYCEINETTHIFVGRRVILQEPRYSFDNVTVKHMLEFEESGDLVWATVSCIETPLICIDITKGSGRLNLLCVPPNLLELNL